MAEKNTQTTRKIEVSFKDNEIIISEKDTTITLTKEAAKLLLVCNRAIEEFVHTSSPLKYTITYTLVNKPKVTTIVAGSKNTTNATPPSVVVAKRQQTTEDEDNVTVIEERHSTVKK